MHSIDLNYLATVSDNDRGFEAELLQVYIEDTELHLEAAKLAQRGTDWDRVAKEAHHIKGASANVGAQEMQTLAVNLEREAKAQQIDSLAITLERMAVELEKVKQLFRERYSL